jgi:predicted site-specific integrase-resolvase
MERELYSPKEVAEILGVNEHTLYKWRASGDGPPFVKLTERNHARVRYERASLFTWVRTRFVAGTG